MNEEWQGQMLLYDDGEQADMIERSEGVQELKLVKSNKTRTMQKSEGVILIQGRLGLDILSDVGNEGWSDSAISPGDV